MAKYKKRADGRYQANIIIGVDPSTGKYKYKTIYAATIKELEEKKSKIVAALKNGTYADDKHYTVYTYGLHWLSAAKKHTVSENTYNGYANIIKNHLGPIRDMELLQVKKTDVINAINLLEGHYDLQRRLKLTVNQIFETAIDDGLLYKNVARNVQIGKAPKSSRKAFTDLESNIILSCCTEGYLDEREQLFVLLLFYTGMRCGELAALDRTNIDIRHKQIHVENSVSWPVNQPVIKSTKTDAGDRYIEIMDPLLPKLEQWLEGMKERNEYYLFTGMDGKPFSKSIYNRFWDKIQKKFQYRFDQQNADQNGSIRIFFDAAEITPHRFRHNFCTMLWKAGINVKEAQIIMGHSDIKVTLGIYTHLDEERALPMSAKLARVFNVI